MSLLIFDLDGTLVDTSIDITNSVNYIREKFELENLSIEETQKLIGGGVNQLVRKALGNKVQDFDTALEKYKKHYIEHMVENIIIYEGVLEGLKELKSKGHTLAILSNKPYQMVTNISKKFQIEEYFSMIIGNGLAFKLKPDPEGLLAIISKFNSNASETWMIGDHHPDIEVAENAKVNSVFVTYGYGDFPKNYSGLTFSSFKDLTDYFKK